MTIHAVDLVYNREATSLTNTHVPQWLNNHPKWDDPRQRNDSPVVVIVEDGDGVDREFALAGVYRFERPDQGPEKSNLVNGVWNPATNNATWARVRYHECFHNRDPADPCSWTDIRYHPDEQSVPEWVP